MVNCCYPDLQCLAVVYHLWGGSLLLQTGSDVVTYISYVVHCTYLWLAMQTVGDWQWVFTNPAHLLHHISSSLPIRPWHTVAVIQNNVMLCSKAIACFFKSNYCKISNSYTVHTHLFVYPSAPSYGKNGWVFHAFETSLIKNMGYHFSSFQYTFGPRVFFNGHFSCTVLFQLVPQWPIVAWYVHT